MAASFVSGFGHAIIDWFSYEILLFVKIISFTALIPCNNVLYKYWNWDQFVWFAGVLSLPDLLQIFHRQKGQIKVFVHPKGYDQTAQNHTQMMFSQLHMSDCISDSNASKSYTGTWLLWQDWLTLAILSRCLYMDSCHTLEQNFLQIYLTVCTIVMEQLFQLSHGYTVGGEKMSISFYHLVMVLKTTWITWCFVLVTAAIAL